ncbi:hypothetical protein [Salirhabdus salicampi]|uniref:hypothetical protein n=1 Tax=Salirhabdus salicampi TaxID=476102 RepID=UPI0020C43B22|nr:hypothetical protein [Salirhabdus salicampi]MCP8615629.1 hypothetical protein [Salirhabdus salicampi]
MFNLPLETVWWFFPWPFIWLAYALIMYFRLKKQDEWEEAVASAKVEKGDE